MMAILEGAEGSPFESIAQMATRSVALAGSDPPVPACEIDRSQARRRRCR